MIDPDDMVIPGPRAGKDNDPQIEMPIVEESETIIDIDPVPDTSASEEAQPVEAEPVKAEGINAETEKTETTDTEAEKAETPDTEVIDADTEDTEAVQAEGAAAVEYTAPILPDLSQIEAMIKALDEKFDKKIATDTHKDELFDKLYNELSQYKKDLYSKLLVPIVNQIISLIEDYNRVIQRVDADTEGAKLLRYLSMVPDDLEEVLQDNGIECYEEEGERYNPKTQRAIGLVMTTDIAKDGLVAERVRKGFWWEGRILKHETVKVYKYKA